jgi:tRNA pseudouridine38-40 synthase
VHARGQVIHFDITSESGVDPGALNYKMSQLLPDDVVIWNVSLAPKEGSHPPLPWHANIAPTGKLYSYRWRCCEFMDPLGRLDRAHWYRTPLDVMRIRSALKYFTGRRDFASFGNRLGHKEAASDGPLDTHRTISRIDLVVEDGEFLDYRLDFFLDGALYKMVRNIVGTLFAIGSGDLEESCIEEIFERRDRIKNPARAAPAVGLTLEHVFYESY